MKDGQFGKVKSYAIIDPERFNDLLNKFISRSESQIDDARKREDRSDLAYYHGQRDVIAELQDMISNFK